MARRKGLAVNGWLVLDKEEGMTSTQAVGKARYIFNARKAGHGGTLDPLATGILPIAFGEATKTVPYLMDSPKSYRFTVRWGAETDTDDSQGNVVKQSNLSPSTDQLQESLQDFIGEITQVPPKFSALKIQGERAYDLARQGEDFELASRKVQIDRLELISADDKECVLETDCGKGTYVRAIARDLGRKLGCLGHITQLRRTKVGVFYEHDAISFDKILDKVENLGHSAENLIEDTDVLKPVETVLDDIPALAISRNDAQRLKNGQPVLLKGRDAPILKGPAYAMSQGTLVALGEVANGEFKPTRVLNLL